jgi:hypothetical protein
MKLCAHEKPMSWQLNNLYPAFYIRYFGGTKKTDALLSYLKGIKLTSMRLPLSSLPTKERPAFSNSGTMSGFT